MRKSGKHLDHASAAARPGDGLKDNLRFLAILVLLAWAVRSFVAAPFSIPSGSMLPTLFIGDYILVAKWPYGYSRVSFPFGIPAIHGRIFGDSPERGDVVVFRHPVADIDLVKRVIGLPGDVVAVSDGRVILNGKPLVLSGSRGFAMDLSPNSPCKTVPPATPRISPDGRRCLYTSARETLPDGVTYSLLDQVDAGAGDGFPPTTIPAGHVFLMGDNRDDSLDSRFAPTQGGVGMVPIDKLIGRALVTFWSTDGSASYYQPWTWFSALRSQRIGNRYSESSR